MATKIELRSDYNASRLRKIVLRCQDPRQIRRLLALAGVYDGMSRGAAARIGGMDRQTLRDWAHRFNAEGPEGLKNRKGAGPKSRLSGAQLKDLADIVETGPDPDKNGVVRWRRVDLKGVIKRRFGVDYHERYVGTLLHKIGFSHMSARPVHPKQDAQAIEDFKKGSVYKSYAFMTCSFSNQRDRTTMDHKQFQDWLSGIDHLSPAQRQEAETVFMGVSEASSSLAAIEASVGESRQCPHCGTPGAISRGKARGLRRYQCKGCNKTFNAATGTPLSGLHRKDKWLAFGTCLSDGLTVRASAERCKFAVNTAFRWRHRFLTTDNPKARKLTGIVEVDETYVLQSQKGERNLERKARRRGGKARKRGLSDEQVPVLVAADRSGMTVSAVLPAVNADTLQSAIEPVVDDDIVLVTDGHRAYPPCAAALGVRHEALNLSGGERVRDAFHIQTVNNRHSQLKDFLRRYRGVATKYLDNNLRWFQRLQLENASPRACRATAIADPCIRFVN